MRPVHGLAAVATIALLGACGKGTPASTTDTTGSVAAASAGATPPVAPVPTLDANSVVLDSVLNALVRIGIPERVPVAGELRIAGRLEVDGYRTSRVGAPVTGRVTDVRALLGQMVRDGERLALITSQEVTAAQLTFLKAYSAERLAERAAQRADTLYKADVIAAAEVQRRRSELEVASAEFRSAGDQLAILGLGAGERERLRLTGQIVPAAPIVASRAGTIIDRRITPGQVVQPADSLFVISDLAHIWAVAAVPEQSIREVRVGQPVAVEVPADPSQGRMGKIVFIADIVDAITHTVRVGVALENPKRTLKPNMLVTMVIADDAVFRSVVPSAAVVRENDMDHLFVRIAAGRVRMVPVRLGPERLGRRAVLDSLPGDGAVVLDGAFHLNTERQRRALEGGK